MSEKTCWWGRIRGILSRNAPFNPSGLHARWVLEIFPIRKQTMQNIDSQHESVVLIEPAQEAAFRKRLQALNKKAEKFGLEAIKIQSEALVIYDRCEERLSYASVLSHLKPLQKGAVPKNPVQLKRYVLQYPVIRLGNWQVVGKLEAMTAGNLQFVVTHSQEDMQAVAQYASQPIVCQHCNTKRKRKDGYVLRDLSTGQHKQVGGSCLQDFTGIDPAAALFLARMGQVIQEEANALEEFLGSGRSNAISTLEFLADTSYLAESFGFVSAAKARESGILATYDEVVGLSNALQRDESLRQDYMAKREKHLARAQEVRTWVLEKEVTSSFDSNLKLLLSEDALALNPKHLAFAAAAVAMFNKERSELAPAYVSQHLGEPGQKLTCILTVHRVVPIETFYGVLMLVLLRDEVGNHLTWKTSACPRDLLDEECKPRFEASFKVKEHGLYKDVAQTTISHLKIVRILEKPVATAD